MILDFIELQGFKSFIRKTRFDFPKEPGLYFIAGRNELEPELEANGSGKTTLWDGFCWILFGKSLRSLIAGNIHTWESKEKTSGVLGFTLDSGYYQISRSWNPNTLKISKDNGSFETKEQKDVDDLIKLDFDSILYSVIFSQFGESFFDLKPTPKSELFSAALKLEIWDSLAKDASEQAKHLRNMHSDVSATNQEYIGRIAELKALHFEAKIQEFETQREENIKELIFSKSRYDRVITFVKNEGIKLEEQKGKLLGEFQELEEFLSEIKEIVKDFNKDLTTVLKHKSEIQTEARFLEKELEKFFKVEDTCPYCNQKVDETHLKNEIKTLTDKKKQLLVDFKTLEEIETDLLKDQKVATSQQEDLSKKQVAIRIKLSEVDSALNKLKSDAQKAMQELSLIDARIEKEQRKLNPYLADKEKALIKIKGYEEEIARLKEELVQISTNIKGHEFWIKGFKDIKLNVISDVLMQLEIEVNNALGSLGLLNWKIVFDVDKENKSGTVKKGFTVMIYSPFNTEPVAWEAWSGGESQRLRLAGTLGFSNFLLVSSGANVNFEVYDEPTRWLSSSGINDLVQTLADRAKDLGKVIYLIDHKNLESTRFSGVFTVVKDVNGSRIEISD